MTASQTVDWERLHHAFGSASDIPALLQRTETFPTEADWHAEPWFSLWSALYHQGDIYPASIAVVPRIVSTLSRAPNKATLSFFLLPASIAIADNDNPVDASAEMRESFASALVALGGFAASALPTITDEQMARAAQAAVLVSQGNFQQAGELLEADA
ncbi:hypothetical protein [Arenimonas sp.]|uniref:hypothetical protein n=1 Tax=Arenimonas sp. TaxID=1872635 RepID=UPI0039E46CD5